MFEKAVSREFRAHFLVECALLMLLLEAMEEKFEVSALEFVE